jgi:hypothetical protein
MTDAFFREQMSRLVGLRFVPADMTTHWEALHDLPEAVLVAAVSRAGRTRVDFPTPHELREDADRTGVTPAPPMLDQTTVLDQPYTILIPHTHTHVQVTTQWTYCCDHCSDSGWRQWWCGDGNPDTIFHDEQSCDRVSPHDGHEWVGPCACLSTNQAIARKRAIHRQYAERLEARGTR